jgi:polyhydroxyalkanoate synthesis regulator phasin
MNATKNEIIQRLEIIPNDKLREVLSFLNYLVWQTENSRTQEDLDWLERDLSGLDNYEPYEWQERELQEGLPVKFIAETSW